jgi:hypothetical protein
MSGHFPSATGPEKITHQHLGAFKASVVLIYELLIRAAAKLHIY